MSPKTKWFLCFFFLGVCGFVSAEEPTIEQEVRTFSFEGYDEKGTRQWQLEGDSARLEGEVAFLKEVKVESFEKGGTTLTSEIGRYNLRTQEVHLEKDVMMETSEGASLKTEALDWDGKARRVTTEKPVTIEKDQTRSEGVGAEAYPDLKQLTLKEKVKVQMGPDLTITSEGPMEIDYANGRAVFLEEVFVQDKEGSMRADKMEVFLDPKRNTVEQLIAIGHVEIKRKESISYSDRAVYNAMSKKVTLEGNPRLLLQPSKEDESTLTANTSTD